MAEFKKLSAVDVVETASDTAKVLIEEDGVIKRVAKSEVGGGNGYDAVLIVKRNHVTGEETLTAKLDFEAVVSKIRNMEPVFCYYCKFAVNTDGMPNNDVYLGDYGTLHSIYYNDHNSSGRYICFQTNDAYGFYVYEDGTTNFYQLD